MKLEQLKSTRGGAIATGVEAFKKKTNPFSLAYLIMRSKGKPQYFEPIEPDFEEVIISEDPRVRVETIEGIERVIIKSKIND